MRIRKYFYETKWTEVIVATRELKCKFQYFASDQHLQCQEMTSALSCLVCFLRVFFSVLFFLSWSLSFLLMKSLLCLFLFSFFEYSLVLLKMYKSAVESRDFVIWVVFFVEFNLCGIFIYSPSACQPNTCWSAPKKWKEMSEVPLHCLIWSGRGMIDIQKPKFTLHLYVPFSQAQMICQIMLIVADSFLIM